MLTIITDQKVIRRYQGWLVKSLMRQPKEKIRISLGHQGATLKTRVYYLPKLDIWFTSRNMADGRCWNAFGCGRPAEETLRPIVCEINFPHQGIDRRTGGLLAADGRGDIYLLHRGKIGGGKKGIGQDLFRKRYQGVWTWLRDGDSDSPALVIGRIKSPLLARQVAQFVFKVEQLKREISGSGQLALVFDDSGFRLDRLGGALEEQQAPLSSLCDRLLVIMDLARGLQQRGCRVGNNLERDLWISSDEGKISHVFDVITGNGDQAIREGAARLLWSNISPLNNPQKYLVLPEAPATEARQRLELLGIRIVTYLWQGDSAVFDLSETNLSTS